MQFHIEGKDFSKVKRSSLDAMRMVAARFMIVPPECVIIAGIEPSSSILVTLMVPEMFITYFEAALSKDVAVKELTDLGIDIIRMGDKVVNIHGTICMSLVWLKSFNVINLFMVDDRFKVDIKAIDKIKFHILPQTPNGKGTRTTKTGLKLKQHK